VRFGGLLDYTPTAVDERATREDIQRLLDEKPWAGLDTLYTDDVIANFGKDDRNAWYESQKIAGLDDDDWKEFKTELNRIGYHFDKGNLDEAGFKDAFWEIADRYGVDPVNQGTDKLRFMDPGRDVDVYSFDGDGYTNISGNFGDAAGGSYVRHAETEGEGPIGQFNEAKTIAPALAAVAIPALAPAAWGAGATALATGLGTGGASYAAGNNADMALQQGLLAGGASYLSNIPGVNDTAASVGASEVPTSLASASAPTTTAASVVGAGTSGPLSGALFTASQKVAELTGNTISPSMAHGLITDAAMDLVADGEIDVESLATGAGLDIAANKITQQVYQSGSLEVPNVFKDGATEIPQEAFRSAVGDGLKIATQGGDGMDYAKAGLDYMQAGGTLGFLAPDGMTGPGLNLPDFNLPGGVEETLDDAYEYLRDDVPDLQPGSIDTPSWKRPESLSLGGLPNWRGPESLPDVQPWQDVDTPSWQQPESLSLGQPPGFDGWGGSESVPDVQPDISLADLIPALAASSVQPDRPERQPQQITPNMTYQGAQQAAPRSVAMPDYGTVQQRPLLDYWPSQPQAINDDLWRLING